MRPARKIAAVMIAASAAFSLAACTSSSNKCVNQVCDVKLSGEGSSTTLGGDGGSKIELISADGGTAKFEFEGRELSCTQGETVNYGTSEITCKKVGDSELELHIKI
jgi:hypothetical protein